MIEATDLDAWAPKEGTVTVEALDALVEEYRRLREDYEAAKKISGEKYALYQDAENKLMGTLKAAGKKSYKVDELGTISIVTKHVVKVPKDIEDKRKLFNWIRCAYDENVLDELLGIHHGKLNSFYNEEAKKNAADPTFHIDGLERPTMVESVSFRRAAKK